MAGVTLEEAGGQGEAEVAGIDGRIKNSRPVVQEVGGKAVAFNTLLLQTRRLLLPNLINMRSR